MFGGRPSVCGSALALGVALVAVAAVVTQAGCSGKTDTRPVDVAASIPVTVATVTMTDLANTFDAGGVVQARTTATMTARILAPVREVRTVPGDRVRTGQVLLVLDGRDLAAHARSARAAALAAGQAASASAAEEQAADAGLTLARATHSRIAALQAKRSATTQELDEATAALHAAEARAAGSEARTKEATSGVDNASAASEAAVTTASFALITAPFDGVVTEKMVEPGNMATPGTPLMRLEDTRGFRLDVWVDQSRIGWIRAGEHVAVSLDSGAGGATAMVIGTVTEIGRAVDADARAFLVKITLPNAATLRSGMFGRARFAGLTRRALTAPAGAIVRHGQVASVFVVEKGVARVRLVNVRDTEVLAGLSEAEMVIVSPGAGVTDGRRVTPGGR
jgi:RND family efflux transporter MFP subunit